jgi:hypothetical protein
VEINVRNSDQFVVSIPATYFIGAQSYVTQDLLRMSDFISGLEVKRKTFEAAAAAAATKQDLVKSHVHRESPVPIRYHGTPLRTEQSGIDTGYGYGHCTAALSCPSLLLFSLGKISAKG